MQIASTRTDRSPSHGSFVCRDILVTTDLSEDSNGAIAEAGVIAQRLSGRLTLFHVVESPDHDEPHWAFSDRARIWAEHDRSAREQLLACTSTLQVPCETVIERAASPAVALLQRIRATSPDLTVMTTHGRRGLARFVAGSIAEQVVRKTRTPVLCVRGPDDIAHSLARCTVLATDFSEGAAAALRAAGGLVEAFGGELVVVYTPPRDAAHPWHHYSQAERWLAMLSQNVPVRLLVDTAPLRTAVERVVQAERAGLLVVPRTEGDERAVNAPSILRHASCSVLVV